MFAHHVDKGRATGGGHLPPARQHLQQLLAFGLGRAVGAHGDFIGRGKAQLQRGALELAHGDVRAELALQRRGKDGHDGLGPQDAFDERRQLAAVGDGPKGAVPHASAAGYALVLLDDGYLVLLDGDGPHGTTALTGPHQVGDGIVGAGLGTAATLAAFVRVDVGPLAGHGDGPKGTGLLALLGQASLAVLGHPVAVDGTAFAGRGDDRNDCAMILHAGGQLARGHAGALGEDFPLLVNAAPEPRPGGGDHLKGDLSEVVRVQVAVKGQLGHPLQHLQFEVFDVVVNLDHDSRRFLNSRKPGPVCPCPRGCR